MKYLDEFHHPDAAKRLIDEINHCARRRWTIMEICGGQTHSLLKHGMETALADAVEFIHGPGCPVCVTPAESIDFAQRVASEPGVVLATFGDMLRVPGSRQSLQAARSQGAQVRIVYSPLDAVAMAQRQPENQIVFFGVGFETTAPSTALAVLQADRLGLSNFSVLSVHVRVQPAMEAILESPDCRVEAFLAAGHVCAVTGFDSYRELAEQHRIPIVITGFEPIDLLRGVLECVRQLEAREHEVVNRYSRAVVPQGNVAARAIVSEVYEPADRPWRGLGVVPMGGLALRAKWARYDARIRYAFLETSATVDDGECRAGDVLSGRLRPTECPCFGERCTPESPLGAPMISSEGACAAYYRYRGDVPLALDNRTASE